MDKPQICNSSKDCTQEDSFHRQETRQQRIDRVSNLYEYRKEDSYTLIWIDGEESHVEKFKEFEQLRTRVEEVVKLGDYEEIVFAGQVSESYSFRTITETIVTGVVTESITYYK